MAKRDYYEILGVPRDADEAALKVAYRAIAMRDHPDRNPDDPGAEERFKEASEAYAILSDAERRRAYDRFGHAGVAGGAPGTGRAQQRRALRGGCVAAAAAGARAATLRVAPRSQSRRRRHPGDTAGNRSGACGGDLAGAR